MALSDIGNGISIYTLQGHAQVYDAILYLTGITIGKFRHVIAGNGFIVTINDPITIHIFKFKVSRFSTLYFSLGIVDICLVFIHASLYQGIIITYWLSYLCDKIDHAVCLCDDRLRAAKV